MTVYNLTINGQAQPPIDVPDDMPLLYIVRDVLGYTGPKYGCGVGICGACTSHVDGVATRLCTKLVSQIATTAKITTIEGLAPGPDKLHPVQEAWIEQDVAQCGFCQAGQIMTAVEFLEVHPDPANVSDAEIDTAMGQNVCRCGTYVRIRAAIKSAGAKMAGGS